MRSPAKPVLLLDGTARVVVGIARCLHRHGITVDLAQFTSSQVMRIESRSIRQVHRLPSSQAPPEVFGEALLGLIDRCGYDMLIPTTDEALLAIRPWDPVLRRKLHVSVPPPEIVDRVLDKTVTLEVARRCGIRVPAEFQFHTWADYEAHRGDVPFPLVAKAASKESDFGFSVRYLRSEAELQRAYEQNPEFGTKYLMQEFCPGVGVGIEFLMRDGNARAVFQHQRLKELPASGGVSVLAVAQKPDPVLVEQSITLLRALGWDGVAMVEFRRDPATGAAALMEVNGRYWGSLPLSLNAGIEFPYYEWQLAHGEAPASPAAYQDGFRTHWRTGEILRLISLMGKGSASRLARESLSALWDIVSPVKDALWDWDDPYPGWLEFRDKVLRFDTGKMLRRLLPAEAVNALRVGRDWGWRPGWIHYREARRRKRMVEPELPVKIKRILFVCSGNIMRSPFAEAMLRRQRPDGAFEISSAGLAAKTGNPADPRMLETARELGVELQPHRATLLDGTVVDRSDVIFIMDELNEALLLSRYPQAAPKLRWLGSFGSGARLRRAIADPYSKPMSEVKLCCAELSQALDGLCKELARLQPDRG